MKAKSKSKSKKRTKQRSVRHGLKLMDNIAFWFPINQAIFKQVPNAAIASTSTDMVSDELYCKITEPIQNSIENMLHGKGTFRDFWFLIQTLSLYSHALLYILENEAYKFVHDDPNVAESYKEYWINEHEKKYDIAENQYSKTIYNIGDRYDKHKVYSLSGDNLKDMRELQANLEELLSWCSLRVIYNAMTKYISYLEIVESRQHKKFNL